MKVLVINCGSSSLKYQLIDSDTEAVIAKGLCERIGIDGKLTHQTMGKDKYTVDAAMPDHNAAVKFVLDALLDTDKGAIASLSEIDAVGHRIVHGGESVMILHHFTTLPTSLESEHVRHICRVFLWLRYLIQHSTRPCLIKHIHMQYLTNITRIIR